MKLIHRAFRVFDRGMNKFNREFDRALNSAVRPRRLRTGRSFLELAERELRRWSHRRRR
jgi:hypothetical protein